MGRPNFGELVAAFKTGAAKGERFQLKIHDAQALVAFGGTTLKLSPSLHNMTHPI
jgi:hypothetical protein